MLPDGRIEILEGGFSFIIKEIFSCSVTVSFSDSVFILLWFIETTSPGGRIEILGGGFSFIIKEILLCRETVSFCNEPTLIMFPNAILPDGNTGILCSEIFSCERPATVFVDIGSVFFANDAVSV